MRRVSGSHSPQSAPLQGVHIGATRMNLEQMREFFSREIPFNQFLGMKIAELRDGYARLELPFRPEFIGDARRPALHGGVISSLIDTAGGAAAWSALESGFTVSTVDLMVDFLEPARVAGQLRAEAEVIRKGNRVCHVRVRVTQDAVLIAE